MGIKTKIDWCDSSWNPVTGCWHGCEYCYARRIAERFGGVRVFGKGNALADLDKPFRRQFDGSINPYPYGFSPTMHRYKLSEPQKWKKPRTIFVCSMADLFGEWVPDEWIRAVFDACASAPQHRYLFLTKNPQRYIDLANKGLLPDKHWYGYSATKQDDLWRFHHADECPVINLFVSIEPILGSMRPCFSTHCPADWVIIGAETGQRKGKIEPKRKWIEQIAMECEYSGRPLFMKESLRELMGDDFRQDIPWMKDLTFLKQIREPSPKITIIDELHAIKMPPEEET